ncbi:Threonylcarbamoyladenosine tRNA methylthiotransferase [Phlyctochytrium planicorne]|nr:Threonylcarbamoyladenosine tRNA methylthiotransferase [Phlyctochytrium planicorne]
MDDIEDIVGPDRNETERISLGKVSKRSQRTSEAQQGLSEESMDKDLQTQDFFRPGIGTVYVKTWGCGHNNSDGEYMAGQLARHGYDVYVEDSKKELANVWILNSCTVKGPSEMSFLNEVNKGKGLGKTVIVAGCVPQGSKSGSSDYENLSIIGVQQIDRVVEVVEESLKGNVVKLTRERKEIGRDNKKRKGGGAPLDLPKIRRNRLVEIIPINTGDLGSYSPEEIWNRVTSVSKEGVKEIWLTSEDTGAYGRDIGTNIVELLWGIVRILESFPLGPMLRIGMTNPPYILDHLDEMVKILNHPKVFSFLHVPVQCGSNRVLDDMRRLYTVEEFCNVVDTLRNGVPLCTIATDVICGFPTEGDEDFELTLALLRKYKFSVLHISQFYPRPGTPAALMPRLPSQTIKSRSREVSQLFNSYSTNDHWLGKVLTVLVTETSTDGKFYVAHDKSYTQVLVPKEASILGKFVEVRIVRTGKFFIEGELLRKEKTFLDIVGDILIQTPVMPMAILSLSLFLIFNK